MMRTGKYVTQLHGELQYKAFVSNPLPFELHMGADLQSLLSKADLAMGRLDSVADMLPNVEFLSLCMFEKKPHSPVK